jgi:hypothetical protein
MPPFLAFIPQVINLVANAFGLDTSDDNTKLKLAELELQAQKLASDQMAMQSNINAVEASSSDPFVSRWRPFIGWVCGIAFSYHFVIQPALVLILISLGKKIELPIFDMSTLMPVLLGMLGLGAMRSYDKRNSR